MNSRQFFASLTYAIRGFGYLYRHEQNFRIQSIIGVLVIFLGMLFGLTRSEWVIVLFLIAFVLVLEIVNSVIERFIDIVKPRLHLHVQMIKDMLAAMVLCASIFSVVMGLIIFWPHISLRIFF